VHVNAYPQPVTLQFLAHSIKERSSDLLGIHAMKADVPLKFNGEANLSFEYVDLMLNWNFERRGHALICRARPHQAWHSETD
jgi:hypothetical protein